MIARDAQETLPVLLKSVRPYVRQIVVGCDELSKDRTAKIAAKCGADLVYRAHVSDWHECPQHGRVLAQHFGEARQESFSHLDKGLDWWLWLDSDDVLEGAELLGEVCAHAPPDAAGIWLNYLYSTIVGTDGKRHTNTLFARERLLRTHVADTRLTWTWEGRVHETVKCDRPALPWAIEQRIQVVHQPGHHESPASAKRNTLLLEIDYETDPESSRTIFYLGNQHFAMGNWQEAVDWYELLCSGIGKNPYELWQAYVYMSLAYERLGDMTSAASAALAAMDVVPQHPEPYLRLATISNLCGEFQKSLFWDQLAGQMQQPPFFVFKNPLDYQFNRLVVRGEALANLGRITEARGVWGEALRTFRDPKVEEVFEQARLEEQAGATAEAFVQVAPMLGDAFQNYLELPEKVRAHGRVRDVVMPSLIEGRGATHRIVFFCGRSLEPWAPPVLTTTGIGGSETAVVEIAKRFAADGWLVDVYNDADKFEGIYDGVGYWDCRRFDPGTPLEVFVSWRNPNVEPPSGAEHTVLWCHDLNYGPPQSDEWEHWDDVLGVSQWHATMLRRYYGVPARFVPNGIDLARFDRTIKKTPFRCVHASSPDRGLGKLLSLWPEILKAEPEAELHIAYGWENIDRMIASGRSDLVPFREDTKRQIDTTPHVVWRGRLSQPDLAQLYSESVAWLAPIDFLEVSCISAMESMAAGCVPVATRAGALPETIGQAGFLIPGPPQSRAFSDVFPKAALGVLTDLNVQLAYGAAGRERAESLTWDHAYVKWKTILGIEPADRNGHVDSTRRELVTA